MISRHSEQVKSTLEQVSLGIMTEVNYKKGIDVNESTGGALAKSCSRPKNMHVEEDKQFMQSLDQR